MLLHLLSDWHRDQAELRRKFTASPDEVFDRYGVEPSVREALRSSNGADVRAALMREMEVVLHEASKGPHVMVPWPGNVVDVNEPDPSHALTGQLTKFKVTGGCFDDGLTVVFSAPNVEVPATVLSISRPSTGLQTIEASVTFDGSQTGIYTLVVTNPSGSRGSCPRCFTVVAA